MSPYRLTGAARARLAEAAAAFEHWRKTTPRRSRIPAELWLLAVELARTDGVAQVAAALRLDYYALKRRLLGEAPPTTAESPAFVELGFGLPGTPPGCVLAFSDSQGRALRIEWACAGGAEVAVVARSLWEAGR